MRYRNPRVRLGKANGREYDRTQVLEENVRKLCRAISLKTGKPRQPRVDCGAQS
jgi:hypothetical protein